jgi:hypothetical protein
MPIGILQIVHRINAFYAIPHMIIDHISGTNENAKGGQQRKTWKWVKFLVGVGQYA